MSEGVTCHVGDLPAEPRGRRLIRIGFGVLWILDGLLQAQPAMPLGLASNVTQPSADGAPRSVVINVAIPCGSSG